MGVEEEILRALVNIRQDVKAGNPPRNGICGAFYRRLNSIQNNGGSGEGAANRFEDAIAAWPVIWRYPNGKPSSVYPVGGPDEYDDRKAAGTLWESKRRLALLNFLIVRFGGMPS